MKSQLLLPPSYGRASKAIESGDVGAIAIVRGIIDKPVGADDIAALPAPMPKRRADSAVKGKRGALMPLREGQTIRLASLELLFRSGAAEGSMVTDLADPC